MRANIAYPFQRVTEESVEAEPWQLLAEEEYADLPAAIEHWDYDTRLDLRRTISFDLIHVLAEARLREDSQLALVVLCTTGKGSVRRVVWKEEVERRSAPIEIRLQISGHELQGDLQLETLLTLISPGRRPLALGASLPGSRLWGDTFSAILEGQQGRLPIAVVDLQLANSLYGLAPWYVDWSGASLEASFLGRVQLLLNTRRPDIMDRLDSGDPTLTGLAAADVAKQILRSLISDPVCEFAGDPESYPPDSLGSVAAEWFQACFPEHTVEEIRSMIMVDASAFEAAIQSAFAPGQE